ncbi:hypothetical protein TEQG_03106 [Trichophyton equinum CBS 127.97]|uniref:Uncharacterized protein n=1 Tax=Trichophyton equinum (strain ATCC MYA-4606 / CBS 127.97) TaxID=559882 RepID=F2PQA6_TRIEC|nr:hypothetical protein TEQG_03106 [Trichophyton equinum CBS 127.97]
MPPDISGPCSLASGLVQRTAGASFEGPTPPPATSVTSWCLELKVVSFGGSGTPVGSLGGERLAPRLFRIAEPPGIMHDAKMAR